MHDQQVADRGRSGLPLRLRSWRDGLVLRIAGWLLGGLRHGRLCLVMPSGRSAVLGGGKAEATLVLANVAVFRNSLMRGSIGFAESYISGDCETPDLAGVLRFFLDNKQDLHAAGGGFFRVRSADRAFHRGCANTPVGSRRNIAAHYDLGNAFYEQWLDAGMTYSSALFEHPGMSLEAAQAAKLARIVAAGSIEAGHDVLEIGCGWGSLAEVIAAKGARVTAITISPAQKAYTEARMRAAGLADALTVRLDDYREVVGQFDRIVSVEMIEAVGEENWARYFETIRDRLKPGGVALLQAITIDGRLADAYRRKADFIQRYIFPGGMLPTEAAMARHATAAGLTFAREMTFGRSYVRTLQLWRERFEAAWPRIATMMGFEERFRRMWVYYLTYCEVGFDRGSIDVGLYRIEKPR
jgi:cyclopropane-fatty-acyl-phospholipid synthase